MIKSRADGALVALIASSIAVGSLGVSLYLPAAPGLSLCSAMAFIMFLFVLLTIANIHRVRRE
ncbi:MAG TPA: hypothetical protein VLZ07_04185 [Syntrophales bacterium]|nr:hypothetical protein [Syntrophales bacterium]